MRKPPYSPLVARRAIAWPAAVLLGGAGCATAAAPASDVAALREQVATMRREHQMDEKRLEALENQFDAQQAELAKLRGGASSGEAGTPALPFVRLVPRRSLRSPPPVPTAVQVREPDEADLAALDDAAARGRAGMSAAGDADALFQQAFEKLKTGDLVGAAQDFQGFAERFPRNDAADNALLDEGIALYGQHRYADALAVLARVEARYPAGDAVPEALWRAADCEAQLGRDADARARLRHLARDFPRSPEGARAREKLGAASGPGSSRATIPSTAVAAVHEGG